MRKLTLSLVLSLAGCGGGSDETVTIYLKQRLGPEGPHGQIAPVLMPVERERREGIAPERQAILEIRVGPSPDERAQGFLETLEPETRLREVTIKNGTAIVDFAGAEPADFYAHGAVVFALTDLPGVERVSLRHEGKPCCVYRHDGSVSLEPLTRRTYDYWQGEPCAARDQPDAVRCRD